MPENFTEHQLKALDIDVHISLTANAGAGKTSVLTERFLKIALEKNIPLRRIVAITFTDKAAGELYEKIYEKINIFLESEDAKLNSTLNKEDRSNIEKTIKRYIELRRELTSANISTIHSFCVNLLKEYPVESGLDANFTPIDSKTSSQILDIAIQDVIKKILESNTTDKEELKYFIRFFRSLDGFKNSIRELFKYQSILKKLESLYLEKNEDEILYFIRTSKNSVIEDILFKNIDDILFDLRFTAETSKKNCEACLNAVEGFNKHGNLEKRITAFKNIVSVFAPEGKISRKVFKIDEVTQIKLNNYINHFTNLTQDDEKLEKEVVRSAKNLYKIYFLVLKAYEEEKTLNSYIDYDDILTMTQQLLKDEEIRKVIADKYDYIMVDEYQDTNSIQYEIFLPIVEHLNKSNFFIVGDEKQSIYSFREAELEVFKETTRNIERHSKNNKILSLPDNFRTLPEICLFNNIVFKKLFNNPDEFYNEVGPSDLKVGKESTEKGLIEFLVSDADKNDITEAELVSQKILHLINSGKAKFGEISILARKNKFFRPLEQAFIKNNIPYSVMGGKGFFSIQVVADIYNYLSFLMNEENDIPLAGILRSPFFFLTDEDLFKISQVKGDSLWKKLLRSNEFPDVVSILKENKDLALVLNPTELIRKIVKDTNYLGYLSSGRNSVQELANFEKLINISIGFIKEGFRTLYDFLEYLEESFNDKDDEGQAEVTDESDSVKMMTIHKAKGLSLPVVFLYGCSDSYSPPNKDNRIVAHKNFGLFTKTPVNNNFFEDYAGNSYQYLIDFINKKKSQAEDKRVLYVALTRAISQLYISFTKKDKIDGTFVELLQKGLGIDFNNNFYTLEGSVFFKDDSEKHLEIQIPISNSIEKLNFRNTITAKDYEFLDNQVELEPYQEETLTATKVRVFNDCPRKYSLFYNYGYRDVFETYKENKLTVGKLKKNDDDTVLDGAEKGTFIHHILQKSKDDFTNNYDAIFNSYYKIEEKTAANTDYTKVKKELRILLEKYYNSSSYKHISSFCEYKNEFEIMVKDKHYYLYGIIDKIIFEKNKIVIVDYKTDNISKKEIDNRFKEHIPQLKFYAYIASKLHPEIDEFEIRIIFVKHPEEIKYIQLNKEEIASIGTDIYNIYTKIKNKNYDSNINHCKDCIFSFNRQNCFLDRG